MTDESRRYARPAASSTASSRTGATPLEAAKRAEPESRCASASPHYDAQWRADAARSRRRVAQRRRSAAVQIIAEIKKASPSRGVLAETSTPWRSRELHARRRGRHLRRSPSPTTSWATCDWLRDVRDAPRRDASRRRGRRCCARTSSSTPTSCVQARAYGADNVLLIVAMLDDALLRDLLAAGAGAGARRAGRGAQRGGGRARGRRRRDALRHQQPRPAHLRGRPRRRRSASGRCCPPTRSSSARAACTRAPTSSGCTAPACAPSWSARRS